MSKRNLIAFIFIFTLLFNVSQSFAQGPIVDVNFKINDVYEEEDTVVIQAIVYNLGNTNINGFNEIDISLTDMNSNSIAKGSFSIEDLKSISFEPGESFFFTGAMNKIAPLTNPYKYFAESSVNWNDYRELSNDIKLYINSEELVPDSPPVIVNNRMLVPISFIATSFDYYVKWDPSDRSVTLLKDSKSIKLAIDNNMATVDGDELSLDVAPMIISDRTMVPISFIANSVGADYAWGSQTKILSIYN